MTEATKNTIISLITSLVLLAASVPAFATFLTPEMVAKLQTQVPVIVGAISTLVGACIVAYKAWPSSKNSILKGASEQSGVQGIVTDSTVANSPALKDNPKIVSSPDQIPTSPIK